MRIKNKYYPYPVIAEGNDSYESSTFVSDADYGTEGHYIKFTLCAEVYNDLLKKMLSEGSVKYAHHIECPQTCFRKLILTDDSEHEYIVHESKLNGVVQVCSFLMANQDIIGYANPDFSRDYKGIKFNIDSGCIMAIGSQVDITINKDKEDLSRASSIFAIRRSHDPAQKHLQVSTNGPKIVVMVPERTCNQYMSLSNDPMFVPVLHSMVVMPALMQVLSELKDASLHGLLYNYEEYRWFTALKKTSAKLSIAFDENALAQANIFQLAQEFLDTPAVKALDNLCSGEEE